MEECFMLHYFDHAATTPVCPEAAQAALEAMTQGFGNPSSGYPLGKAAAQRREADRAVIARALGCLPEELFFTSCGTEGDNWALRAAAWQNRHVGKHIVTTAVEHSAVLECCKWLEREGYEVTYLSPEPDGSLSAARVLEAVRPDTAVVSVMLVNNELGTVHPVADIARGLAARNPKTLLHTDAVQGLGTFSARALGADFVTVSAHKIGGPKGIGALYIGPRVRNPRPLLAGGGQERGLRSGTEATAQIAGFARAAELRLERREQNRAHLETLHAAALEKLLAIPDMIPIGAGTAPHILAVSLAGWPAGNIVNDLGSQGICISAGSACHQGKPSHVVAALKLPKRAAAGVIRLSFGPETTEAEIDVCAQALRRHRDTRMPML